MKNLNALIRKARQSKSGKASKKFSSTGCLTVKFEFEDRDLPSFFIVYANGETIEIFDQRQAEILLGGSVV